VVADTDLLSLVGVPVPPADWPGQARAMWIEVGVSAIFQEVRRAGWLRWTREPGSVRAGGAYADAARGNGIGRTRASLAAGNSAWCGATVILAVIP
jgi:hypothetical protein